MLEPYSTWPLNLEEMDQWSRPWGEGDNHNPHSIKGYNESYCQRSPFAECRLRTHVIFSTPCLHTLEMRTMRLRFSIVHNIQPSAIRVWTLDSPDWLSQRLPKQMQGTVVFGVLEQSCADKVSTFRTIHCIIVQGSLTELGGGATSYMPAACYRHRYLSTFLGYLLGIQRETSFCKDMLGRC